MNLALDSLVKVVGSDGRSMHGGKGQWIKGRWRSVDPPIVPCVRGLHVVTIAQASPWLGPRIGVVEVDGTRVDHDDKTVVERARVIEWLTTWNERTARLYAADVAEHVLHIFAKVRPDDDRPRLAIEAARAFARGEIDDAARDAAWAAAWDADGAAAWAAAWAAAGDADGAAARAAARAAAWAVAGAAARAVAWDAARDAARAVAGDAARDAEVRWQGERLLAYLQGRP